MSGYPQVYEQVVENPGILWKTSGVSWITSGVSGVSHVIMITCIERLKVWNYWLVGREMSVAYVKITT